MEESILQKEIQRVAELVAAPYPLSHREEKFALGHEEFCKSNHGLFVRLKSDGRLCLIWPASTGRFQIKMADGNAPPDEWRL